MADHTPTTKAPTQCYSVAVTEYGKRRTIRVCSVASAAEARQKAKGYPGVSKVHGAERDWS